MLKFASIPLLFLFIGSLLGVFLRWQFITPTPGINYSFFLHGHSHIMFLGWVFNALYIGFITNHIVEKERKLFRLLFYGLQILVVGMLISFPLQGYGFYSILFSTLHTITAIVFSIAFFIKTKYRTTPSAWYARTALIFFLISTVGPFALGYLMANGMGQTHWYYFAIYFYLHFQYNGLFLFGVFSLIFTLFENRNIPYSFQKAKKAGTILAATCIPAYFLSILWAKPGYIFNLIGGLTAFVQFIALGALLKLIAHNLDHLKKNFSKTSMLLSGIVLVALVLKLSLQLLSAFPFIAQMAYELRPVVIAYLHLVLLGVVSLSLLVWYLESNLIDQRQGKNIIAVFLIAAMAMEICLIVMPWWTRLFGHTLFSASEYLLLFTVVLSLSCFLLYRSCKKTDKNQQAH